MSVRSKIVKGGIDAGKGFWDMATGWFRGGADNIAGSADEQPWRFYANTADDVVGKAVKNPIYKRKWPYVTAGAVGIGGLTLYNALQEDSTPAGVRDYSQYVPRPQANPQSILDRIGQQQAEAQAYIAAERNKAMQGFGDPQRAAMEKIIGERTNFVQSQAGSLRDEFGEVGGVYGDNVGRARQAGAEGAAGIRNVYGKAANQTRKAAASKSGPAGRTRTGGLTPVSGSLASMPDAIQSTGASLAKYLGEEAAIAARDAGFDAATAIEYGNAVANDMAARAYFQGLEDRTALELDLANRQDALGAEFDQMMREVELGYMDRKFQTEMGLEEQRLQEEASNIQPENLTPMDWAVIDDEWERQVASDAQEVMNWQAAGVTNSTEWAQWLADKGLLAEVVYGQPE